MFGEKYTRKFNDVLIEYGIIKGNSIIFFMKPGQDGTVNGVNNLYYNIGKFLNEKYGFTIVLSSNSYDFKNDPLEDGMKFIGEYAKNNNIDNYQVYYFGYSNGGMLGSRWGYKYSLIKKMFLINTPLFMNCHKILNGLEKFNGEKVVMVYGSLDPSIKFVGMLDLICSNKVCYYIIEGQSHNITLDYSEVCSLIEKYMIN